jgi:hypothetical protein
VTGSYHEPWNVKSFRMSKSDLQARPIYHHKRDSIEAHLTIVFAALPRLPLDRGGNPMADRRYLHDSEVFALTRWASPVA